MLSVNATSHAIDQCSHEQPGVGCKKHCASAEYWLVFAASDERMSCLKSKEDKGSLGSAVGQPVKHLELVY